MDNQPKEMMHKIESLYGEEYDKVASSIKEMENQTKNYIKDIEKQLDTKFKEFNTNLKNNFSKLTIKFSKAFGLDEENIAQEKSKLLQRDTKKYLDQLIKIKNIHEQILESIKVEMSILINSLDISKSLEEHNPIQKFLEKEFNNIINSWLFIKLNFDDFNLTKAINSSNLDDDFKNFVYKICQNKNIVMNISPARKNQENKNIDYKEMQKQDLIMISEKYNDITKIKINQIKNVDIPFKLKSERHNFPKLKSLKFNNCSFSENKKDKYALIEKCIALEKLIFNGTYNFEAKMLMNFSKNLTKLILSNINFINPDFKDIMDNYIIKSESLRNSLEFLSFSNNCLSIVNMEYPFKYKFHALKELDFHRNRLTKFTIGYDNFYQLKCINCCYNKFSKSYFEANDKVIALLSGNIFLTGLNKYKNYFNKLEKQLSNYNYTNLTHLTISYVPFEFGKDYFERIKINNNILISLKQLNLSHNNLNCDILFNLILNNMGCINLKDLNLCGNKLDDNFFKKFLDNNYNTIFTKLQKINLVDNLIGNETEINTDDLGEEPKNKNREQDIYKLRLIYKFIENNKNLSKLYLNKNPMCDKSIISTDLDEDFSKLIEKDNQNKIVIDSFYSFLKKIMDELLMNEEEKNNRAQFNIKFDVDTNINLNSENFNYQGEYIMFK